MSDPERLAYWQDRYTQYRKAANKHLAPRAKRKEKHVKSFSDGIPALFKTWVSRIELIK